MKLITHKTYGFIGFLITLNLFKINFIQIISDLNYFIKIIPIMGAWIVGSVFPDFDFIFKKYHRTYTHYFYIYLVLIFYFYFISFNFVLICFCLACLLHIFMDSLTPMGVPVIHPLKRKSFRLCYNESPAEYLILLFGFFIVFLFIYYDFTKL